MSADGKSIASGVVSRLAPWLLGAAALIMIAAGVLLATGNKRGNTEAAISDNSEQHVTAEASRATPVSANQSTNTQKAPDFDIPSIQGGRIRLRDYRGKIVMLDFWSVACGPCIESTAHYQGMYEKYRARGFVVIGINLDSYPELVKRFIDRAHLTYPIGFASGEIMKNYGGMYSIPQSFLLDKNGNIVRQYNGWGALYAYQSERDVRRLLGLEQ